MESKGHQIVVSSREKECTFELLNSYGIPYLTRGTGKNGVLGKLLYILKANFILYKRAAKFKPDFFLSMASPYAAQVSWLMGKPHITFDDTEHADIARKFYQPFSKVIFTPFCFTKDLGPKQIRFNSFLELCYLHPNYFTADPSIFSILNLNQKAPYVFLRFVSWNANHDIGQSGLSLKAKRLLVSKLKDHFNVFISSEGLLPEDLEKFRIKIPAHKMHDVLASASLFIGEGATMASECAMLGTPAIYVNSLDAGTLKEQEKLGLIFGFRNSLGVMEKVDELLANKNLKIDFALKKDKMVKALVDPTAMLVEYLEKEV
jgi:predicted glycosyltransferase